MPLGQRLAVYLLVGLGLAVTSLIVTLALDAGFGVHSPSMTFLVGVIVAAIWLGREGALASAVTSFLVYNFYLVEPRFSIALASADELLTLLFYIVVAIVIGGLAGNLRDARERERGRARLFSRLFAVGRAISARTDEAAVSEAICEGVRQIAGGDAVIAWWDGGEPAFEGGPRDHPPPPADALARHAAAEDPSFADGAPLEGAATEDAGAEWRIFALRGSSGAQRALLWRPPPLETQPPDAEAAIRLIAELAAVSLERGRLMERRIELDALAAADKLRTALMSSISHDFRTPLATILTSATALKLYGRALPEADRADMLDSIEEEAERLNRFVGNILDMTRLDASALQVRSGWVDPADVLESAVDRIAARLGERRLVRRIPAAAPAIYVDALLLEQAIVNVLENALAHTPPSAAIEVGGLAQDRSVRLWVEDDGPGVPEPDLPRIFDKFHRVDGRPGQSRGTGLGLSISKGFVEAMGGRIEAVSPTTNGRGLRVDVTFPLQKTGET